MNAMYELLTTLIVRVNNIGDDVAALHRKIDSLIVVPKKDFAAPSTPINEVNDKSESEAADVEVGEKDTDQLIKEFTGDDEIQQHSEEVKGTEPFNEATTLEVVTEIDADKGTEPLDLNKLIDEVCTTLRQDANVLVGDDYIFNLNTVTPRKSAYRLLHYTPKAPKSRLLDDGIEICSPFVSTKINKVQNAPWVSSASLPSLTLNDKMFDPHRPYSFKMVEDFYPWYSKSKKSNTFMTILLPIQSFSKADAKWFDLLWKATGLLCG